jgi:hypothetical protein
MARNRTRAQKREAKRKAVLVPGGHVLIGSDWRLRSVLGLMLFRCWLYSGATELCDVDFFTRDGRPIIVDREGNTHHYR